MEVFVNACVGLASCGEDVFDREDAFVTVIVTETGEYVHSTKVYCALVYVN